MAVKSDDIGKRLIEILGLPKETRLLEIRLEAGSIATIKGEFYISPDQLKSFCGVFEDYKADIKVKNPIGVDEYLEQNKIL